MVAASQLRAGMAIRFEGQVYKVLAADYHPGQGKMGGTTHARLRNLSSGTLWEHGFRSDLKLEDLPVEKQSLDYLYADGEEHYFMNPDTFEQLAAIRNAVDAPTRVAVCFDTAHALVAGYEYRSVATYAALWDHFDHVLGLDLLRCFHLNDSKKDLGSRVDRHDHIGQGCVGLETFRRLINDPRFDGMPMVLETPKGDEMLEDIENLRVLRELIEA